MPFAHVRTKSQQLLLFASSPLTSSGLSVLAWAPRVRHVSLIALWSVFFIASVVLLTGAGDWQGDTERIGSFFGEKAMGTEERWKALVSLVGDVDSEAIGAMTRPSEKVLKEGVAGVWNGSAGSIGIRDRLFEDKHYLTSAALAGWTNQVFSAAHTIHLAILSHRIPILPSFLPHHTQLGYAPPSLPPTIPIPFIPFSSVFDLPHLFAVLSQPNPTLVSPGLEGIVEWEEIVDVEYWSRGKERKSNEWSVPMKQRMKIGCWKYNDGIPDGMIRAGMNPTYSSFPHSVKDFTTTPLHFSLNDLGPFLLPSNPIAASYIDRLQGNTPTDVLLPDDQLSCIDHVYYANSESHIFVATEWSSHRPSGAWDSVGQHMVWQRGLLGLALGALREISAISEEELIPSFVSVHIRHGDFLKSCPHHLPSGPLDTSGRPAYDPARCLPLSAYSIAVDEVLSDIANPSLTPTFSPTIPSLSYPFNTSSFPTQVLVTTDSEDPVFLESIRAKGWKMIGRETSERLRREGGDWVPMLAENVLLSLGRGLVGTSASTMSIINARRVESWHGGSFRFVDWFSPM